MGESVDPTGLTFTVTYSDGTEPALVSPQAHTPTTWGETAGTQTCTFTYTEDGESVSCAVEATVVEHAAVLTSLNITGTPAAQYVGQAPDLTGLTFKAVYSDTSEETVDASDITVSPATWAEAGSATLTCSYTEDETTVSDTVSVTVHVNFEVNGTMATQYQNRAVDTTGLTYTYNGSAVDPSDVTVSPATWESSSSAQSTQTATFTYDGNTATKTADVLRTVASLPVTHTSSIPMATARSGDIYETFYNVIDAGGGPGSPGANDWYFVIDVEGGTFAPVSLSEGDCVLWVQDKSAFDLDSANNCDGTYVGTAMSLYGIDGMNLDFGPAPNAPAYWTDFKINMPLTGTYTASADAEICWVFGRAKANVADATTLKPSDIDLIAVWDITYTMPD